MPARTYQQVLDFWFSPKWSPDYLKPKSFWYGGPKDDAYVRKYLSDLYQEAKDNNIDAWIQMDNGMGALALILLLDQVPRNIFRGSAKAYATDGKAVEIARYAVDQKWDKDMPDIQKRYMYSPFNHSENLHDQERSLALFTELGDPYHMRWARDFYEQIKRDGRFKHRDAILKR
ncbi:hypothetical protein BGW36DRAFT_384544 [Talaromyces proteolyticus]|uniref:DUF924 domain-containing protein n=1 Tax=Talaromyces proteolyticus TaxID=1131652 RepID=A0AAD4KLZ1_9EURO|nr:uncharacterized protein BGW36DRAFT_384544 [Talaromyces proteolyticus]KAH8694204.1 hypothetical protein BGW36DRAFT_384544 [Talaromyces proteolyticus]